MFQEIYTTGIKLVHFVWIGDVAIEETRYQSIRSIQNQNMEKNRKNQLDRTYHKRETTNKNRLHTNTCGNNKKATSSMDWSRPKRKLNDDKDIKILEDMKGNKDD